MSRVLIFGAGGFVGSYLAKELRDHNYEVIGSDLKIPEYKHFSDFKTGNLLDKDSVMKIVSEINPDAIINLAAISSVGQSWNIPDVTMQVNVVGAINLMEAAKTLENIPKLMFIGSSEEYKISEEAISEKTPLDANNPYGISKLTQERFAELYRERYGMEVYYVRPFNHTGVGQRDNFVLPSFCKQAAEIDKTGNPGVIHVGNLAARRDFSDVRDIVRAYRMILESGDCRKVYNVGSGEAHELSELLQYITGLSEQKIDIQVDKDRFRPIDTPVICCDHSLITKELGWKPECSIYDTLKEMFLFYKKQ